MYIGQHLYIARGYSTLEVDKLKVLIFQSEEFSSYRKWNIRKIYKTLIFSPFHFKVNYIFTGYLWTIIQK